MTTGIVNRNAETDQGDEVLDKLTDVGERSDGPDEQNVARMDTPARMIGQERETIRTQYEDEERPIAPRTNLPSTPIPPLPGCVVRR